MKKTLIDANDLKSVAAKAAECDVQERWLRYKVRTGQIRFIRIGWNVFVPQSETDKIRTLAAQRKSK